MKKKTFGLAIVQITAALKIATIIDHIQHSIICT